MQEKLSRSLTSGQMSMIAIGSALGTGLFLGSSFAIGFAGPSIIISYIIGGLMTLVLMKALIDMSSKNPTTASFAHFAGKYIHPSVGFVTRYNYWGATVIGVGLEVTASAIYMAYWFPDISTWIWVIIFSLALIGINFSHVTLFGKTEYWFSMIKLSVVVAFIIIGIGFVFQQPAGTVKQNLWATGELVPFGFWGIWCGILVALFGYLGTETIAVAAGEAKNPQKDIKRALRLTVIRLFVFYIAAIALMLIIVPWNEAGTGQSPFVTVLSYINIPFASSIMNFVILIAALSAMNSQIYIATRMLYSLSEANYAPKAFLALSKKQIPYKALMVSLLGIVLSVVLNKFVSQNAYLILVSIVIFGGLCNWIFILLSHFAFIRKEKQSYGTRSTIVMSLNIVVIALLTTLLLSTLWIDAFAYTLYVGVPWIIILFLSYQFVKKSIK
ncbi:amino acid permease [Thorsellia anophelis]|uniref:L-asparagine transporter n=1 Tax=Thorsellia anophelis DSM 18579 TaxID=1123402 RepID=A0A1I0A063_9GAMM|nr:amino acid permease [Thorsellia anophelis]SES87412.1 L-asparagine transporter [Thorsellia anophelis DSM 18579]